MDRLLWERSLTLGFCRRCRRDRKVACDCAPERVKADLRDAIAYTRTTRLGRVYVRHTAIGTHNALETHAEAIALLELVGEVRRKLYGSYTGRADTAQLAGATAAA